MPLGYTAVMGVLYSAFTKTMAANTRLRIVNIFKMSSKDLYNWVPVERYL